ncbi:hypothetical protein E4T56_gene8060 [Termitomyces sp. T112]|nr:hypothetical protein E4T56_gene8060 [Termitomyces sp. T112]
MANLASQLEKITMAHAFLDWVDHLLSLAHAFLAKDPCLAVTAIFQTWLQWFKTMGSGVEWLELANVKKECCQLYEQYKGEEWVFPFDVHFAPVDPSLEFLLDDLIAGMIVSAPAVTSASDTAKVSPVTSEEGEGDVEMRETTPLAMVAEVEQEASNMEVKGKEEFKAAPVTIEEDKEEDKEAGEVKQIGNDKLEWLGKDLAWPMPLMLAASLADFDERAAGVEQQFQRELEVAKEELIVARAWYAVAKQTLVTLVGYRCNCQAFLAWQEENNIGEGDWEKEDLVDVSDDNANLDA